MRLCRIKQIKTLRRAQSLALTSSDNQTRKKEVSCRRSFYFYDDEEVDRKMIEGDLKQRPVKQFNTAIGQSRPQQNRYGGKFAALVVICMAAVMLLVLSRDHHNYDEQHAQKQAL